MNVEKVALNVLVEDPHNARRHSKRNLEVIKNSLTMHGQVEPLIVQKSRMRVIGGNGRLKVMRDMGWTEADCVLLDLDDRMADALAITLNRSAELASWDFAQLANTLQTLDAGDWDMDALTGFNEKECASIAEWVMPEDGAHPIEKCPTCGRAMKGENDG